MSQYVSRALADRRAQARRDALGLRIAICICLLLLAVASGVVGYFFLAYTDQIAAHTRDDWQTIGAVGICSVFISFTALIFVVLVAAGIHERR